MVEQKWKGRAGRDSAEIILRLDTSFNGLHYSMLGHVYCISISMVVGQSLCRNSSP